MALFYDLFKDLRQALAPYDRALENAEIISCTPDLQASTLTSEVRFNILLKEETLDAIAKIIADKYQLESAVIEPRFDKRLLSNKYDSQLVEIIKRRIVVANGYLNGCEFCYGGDFSTLEVKLAGGGREVLCQNNCEKILERVISERFGVELKVSISQPAQTEKPSLEEIQQQIDREIQTREIKKTEVTASVIEEGIPYYTDSLRVIYGNKVKSRPVEMSEIKDDDDRVTVWGKIFSVEAKPTKNGDNYRIIFKLTDYTSSQTCSIFEKSVYVNELLDKLTVGAHVLLSGGRDYDSFRGEMVIRPRSICLVTPIEKTDDEPEKRVELHLHTNMSQLDAVTPTAELVKRAIKWGHRAIAITDHGCVQGFPEACEAAGGKIKIIYGVEGYLVDDINEPEIPLNSKRTYHITILAKNNVGLKNLYKLISMSNIKYFYKRPRISRSELIRHREGLIIGSACEQGEVYRAVVTKKSDEELTNIASFYDYFEIMPVGNNQFMIRAHSDPASKNPEQFKEFDDVKSFDDIRAFNRRVIEVADALSKPVVATGDVHFIDEKDSVYREIIQHQQGFKDASNQAPLYFRTTREMLDEFAYLGEDTAREIVITNPNKIADKIEIMRPFPKGTYQPSIEGSEEQLRKICWDKAKEWYEKDGKVPELVEKRLNRELDSIIANGYAVLYIIAQRLVWDSEEHGYHVGSRGSVGSSFVATMAGISEVNPLVPHYRCPKCNYTEFFENGEYGSGFDLPKKACPECGTDLIRDGHEIPFETFLGFHGDKAPDIDLNFSGEYQGKAHRYTEELFGKTHVFKAGTITSIADKTAYGYVKKYIEETQSEDDNTQSPSENTDAYPEEEDKLVFKTEKKHIPKAEEDRLTLGCTGIKRSTGQHPGGMVVIPDNYEVYDFTPVQYPADKTESDMETTHFDFNSLHDTILKLDELGHDVPTLYKHLEDLTGIPVTEVDVCDPKIIKLCTSPEPLGVTAEEIDCQTGTLSIPEMGTPFVRQMLLEAQPKSFSDMLQVSGLSHGTDVWNGNAQDLIKDGTCTISSVIGTRDSIMTYLMHAGLEPSMAFKIMELTRKGKVAKNGFPEGAEEAMRKCNVPEWYMDSCRKIKYMFPKAHAAAYVFAAFRLAWYKIYKPLEYYTAFLTVRGGDLDAATIVKGRKAVVQKMKDISFKMQNKSATAKEEDQFTALQVANEMMARGIELLPIDIYKSKAKEYIIEDGKIRLPFNALSGVGDSAAEPMEAARNDGKGEFVSIEDFADRAKAGKTVIEALRDCGAFGDLPESSQLSLF
ncbi:MAG: PolC-type DNA polymerase III [Clostridiaceae bacterium]|nr:PolC-type DNA polymerase III [Clostridiaceae bacterium]